MPPQSSESAIIKFASSSRLASSTASRSCPTHLTRSVPPTSQASRLLPRSSEKVARVGPLPKNSSQCLQTLEEEVQNESVIAIPRSPRSAALLDRHTRPS